jgi:uncharacterized phiE125 gp8 family phage protein
MSLQLNTPPAAEPVTLSQAKAWLRVESGDDEDALITSLIGAARARAEWHTGRAFITQGWTLWLDRAAALTAVPLPPLQGVDAVTLYMRDDSALVLDPGDYRVDTVSDPGRVALKRETGLMNLRGLNALSIAFTCGYGDAGDVPAPIAQAVLQILASLYEHRGGDKAPTPDSALALLAPYRMPKI